MAPSPTDSHTPWMLLEHLRLAQWDILEFSRNSKHASPEWPEGYWPAAKHRQAPPHGTEAFSNSAKTRKPCRIWSRILRPISTLASPGATARPFFVRPCSWPTTTPTTSGQLVDLRRLLGAWKG